MTVGQEQEWSEHSVTSSELLTVIIHITIYGYCTRIVDFECLN